MGHGYEQTPVSEIRKLLKEKYNVDDETLQQTKKKLVDLLLAYNDIAIKPGEYTPLPITGDVIESIISPPEGKMWTVIKEPQSIVEPHSVVESQSDVDSYSVVEWGPIEEEDKEGFTDDTKEEFTEDVVEDFTSFGDLEVEIEDGEIVNVDEIQEVLESQQIEKKVENKNKPTEKELGEEDLLLYHNPISEIPSFNSPEWSDYAMSLLTSEEMFEQYPRLRGLRRLTELLIGPIISKEIECYKSPNDESSSSTIGVKITCLVNNKKHPLYNKTIIETSISDANTNNNSVSPFCYHMSSVCENRAEARCYRNILRINTVTFEEVNAGMNTEESNNNGKISQIQIICISKICERLGINAFNFINKGSSGIKYDNIEQIDTDTALKMIQTLNEISSGSRAIPEGVGDYDPNWIK